MKNILLFIVYCFFIFGCKKKDKTFNWNCDYFIEIGNQGPYYVPNYMHDTFYDKTQSEINTIVGDSTYNLYVGTPQVTHHDMNCYKLP